jgi:hypothetical protein
MRRLLLALAVTGVLAFAPAASAEAPVTQAWWWSGSAIPSAPPDVPADGLLVQGGPSAPTAYAAVRFEVPGTATVGALTLHLSGTATPNSALKLCRIEATFEPVQGGDLAKAPAYDCRDTATGAVQSDRVTVDASQFVDDGVVMIALLPVGAADRMVFAKPGTDALEVHLSSDASGAAGPVASEPGAFSGLADAGSSAFLVASGEVGGQLPADAGTAASAPPLTALRAASGPPASASAATVADPSGISPLRLTLVLAALALALAFWVIAGSDLGTTTQDEPGSRPGSSSP